MQFVLLRERAIWRERERVLYVFIEEGCNVVGRANDIRDINHLKDALFELFMMVYYPTRHAIWAQVVEIPLSYTRWKLNRFRIQESADTWRKQEKIDESK